MEGMSEGLFEIQLLGESGGRVREGMCWMVDRDRGKH